MTNTTTIEILNELLALEQASLIRRVRESTPFVELASAAESEHMRRMADEVDEHVAALSSLILDLRGGVRPRTLDAHSAHLHFLELGHLLPRAIEDEQAITARYEAALQRLGGEPQAHARVSSILARHRRNVEQLAAFQAAHAPG